MDPIVDQALRAGVPGPFVSALGLVHRGAALTATQIRDYSLYWRNQAELALAGDSPVLVGLGDSLTQAIGASAPENAHVGAVRKQLEHRLGRDVAVLNLSRSGARIPDVLGEQLPALAASKVVPIAVLCTVGSNDLLRTTRPHQVIADMSELVGELPRRSILSTVPGNPSGAAGEVNRALRQRAETAGVVVVDVAGNLRDWASKAADDKFHPNDAGYETWSEQFVLALDSLPWPSSNGEAHS